MTAVLRVLILEDLPERYSRILHAIPAAAAERDIYYGFIRAGTAAEAIVVLEHDHAPDVILLDYDLDQGGKLDAAVTGHGGRVASWLARQAAFIRQRDGRLPRVIIHSKNGPGAADMLVRLLPAGYPVAWIPAPLGANCDQQFKLIGRIIAGWAAEGGADGQETTNAAR